jgi:hypothetical protein
LLLHAGLLNSVLRHRPQLPSDALQTTMLWLKLAPPSPPPSPPPAPRSMPRPLPIRHRQSEPVATAAPAIAIPAPQPLAEKPPARISAEQMLSMAKRDLGKIDRELRKEQAGTVLRAAPGGATPGSPLQRLQEGIEEAHQAAPNKWYQAAKVEDITPPGNDARKIYRITGVLGTYCVRYADKNRADQGKANVGEALIGACPHAF